MIRVTAIDLDQNGKPQNEKLGAAVAAYCTKELGTAVDWRYYLRAWVVLSVKDDDPEYFEVIGVTAIKNIPDVPVFHVTPLTADKDGLRLAEQARDAMVARLHSYCEDLGQSGRPVLIYISETGQRYWRRFLTKIGVTPANRFQITI